MKKIIIILAVLVISLMTSAQQDYQFTHYMFDNLSFNPAYAGITKNLCGTVMGRKQWAGFDGGPTTTLVNVHTPVPLIKGGVGLSFVNDKIGFENNNIMKLAYSYHIKGVGLGTLGVGISGGIIQKSIDANWIPPDGGLPSDDPLIRDLSASGSVSNVSEWISDFNFGVFYHASNMYAGVSITHLGGSELESLNIKNVHHYWVTAGYIHQLGNPNLKLRPSLLAKSDVISTQIDLNVNLLYKDMLWGGLTYRLGDVVAPMVGYQKSFTDATLRVGLSYGVTTSRIRAYGGGSYELVANYCLNLVKPQILQKSKSPRYL